MTDSPDRRLFCFGLGYSAVRLADDLVAQGWSVAGTCRGEAGRDATGARGIAVVRFDGMRPLEDAARTLGNVSHVLVSVPPGADGDPVLRWHGADIAAMTGLGWLGYLSTTAVYGDRQGGWVDESSPLDPTGERGRRRVAAENAWRALRHDHGVPVHVFRLAGIYGPGRSVLDQVRAGAARRIVKPGHVFSRIHVDDIAAVLAASMARPNPGAVYNVCDDCPAPSAAVTAHACALLGVDPPPEIPFERADLSAMARSFYDDNKRVRNGRIKTELGVTLRYPDYRSGLAALAERTGS